MKQAQSSAMDQNSDVRAEMTRLVRNIVRRELKACGLLGKEGPALLQAQEQPQSSRRSQGKTEGVLTSDGLRKRLLEGLETGIVSQKYLAETLGFSNPTMISNWKCGRVPISASRFVELDAALKAKGA